MAQVNINGETFDVFIVRGQSSEPIPNQLTLADGEGGNEPVSESNPLPVSIQGAGITIDNVSIDNEVEIKNDTGNPIPTSVAGRTPTTTSVASSASSVAILAANANRKGLSIANVSTATLYLSFAATATTANSFLPLPPGAFILLDQQLIVTSAISGIWSAANGTAQVTEYV